MSNELKFVKVTVDGKEIQGVEGMTILAAAKMAGVEIPTLCYLAGISNIGSCRICVVEVEGQDGLAAACNTPVFDGMVIRTRSPRVIAARRENLRTILASHRSECTTCKRSGTCALQKLSNDFNLEEPDFDGPCAFEEWDPDFPLQRDASKCIRCMRCVAECAKVQHCQVWEMSGPAANRGIRVTGNEPIGSAKCALCGQCITHCPTGALTARDDTQKVLDALADPDTITVIQVAPAVRTAWGEQIGLTREQATPGRMAQAMRELGFDYVFDTDFAADLTIMEEASEFIEWVKEGKPRPMFTSCCPGWVRFAKLHYPQFVEQLSTSKSPHQMMGAVVKNTMRAEAEAAGKKVFCLSIMPCVAKKYECDVPQLATEAGRDVDAVITTREFDRMLRMYGIDGAALPEGKFDDPLGLSTGAATIFGRTGGVMEAALRTAANFLTGENPPFTVCDTTAATPDRPWVDKEIEVAGLHLRIAIASGLENTAKLLDALESGQAAYDFVEIMACPGGCVGGGGQPIVFNQEMHAERAKVLNKLDGADTLRYSHENPDIKKLYDEWVGKPLSETAEEWLHTHQKDWDI